MNFQFKKIFNEYKRNIIYFSLVIFLIVNLYNLYFYGFQIWNFIGGCILYLVFLDILNNGSYLFLSKFEENSIETIFFIRFLYLILFLFLSIYCVLAG